MCDSKQDTRHTMYYDTTRQTSSMQNGDRQVGHGHRQLSQISGCVWSCRLANHLPMHSRHHIGRQRQLRQGDMVSASSAQRRLSLMDATACMQPTHCSNSYTCSVSSLKTATYNMSTYYYCICIFNADALLLLRMLVFFFFFLFHFPTKICARFSSRKQWVTLSFA